VGMRHPKHFTPPPHLNIDFNPATGLYDVSVRNPLLKEKPVYSMPLELIRVLAKYYHLRGCGSGRPSLEKFYMELSKADRAQVISSKPQVQQDDFFPDPEFD
jgi:hypothetical protein